MRLSVFKLVLFSFLLSYSGATWAQEEALTRREMRHIKFWSSLIPKYAKLQYAGSMGMLSFGLGWNYGKDHWETDVFLGIIPRNADHRAMVTLTLKQNYLPWKIPLKNKIVLEPLTCGLYINSLLDGDFWGGNPDKYPSGYYWFSTRFRFHIFMGQRIAIDLSDTKWPCKSLTFFYEISSCDLYIVSRAKNHVLKPRDYLSLSFGIKAQIL